MSAPAATVTEPIPTPANNANDDHDRDSDDESGAGKAELTPEERAKKAAAKKKRKQAAAKRKKEQSATDAAASATTVAASSISSSADSTAPTPESLVAVAAALDELEVQYPSHPMHQYFSDASNGTKLQFTRSRGRHVLATRPIPAGKPVFTMAPYAAVVKDPFVHAFCGRCFQTAPSMLVCAACKHTRFCSTRCKNAMANIHNLECKALSRLSDLPLESESAALRMLIRIGFLHQEEQLARDQHAEKAASKTKATSSSSSSSSTPARKPVWLPKPGLSFADLSSMVSHMEEVPAESKRQLMMIVLELQNRVIQDADIWKNEELSLANCVKILYQIQVNAHSITNEDKYTVGLGLYIPAAYLNHSCRPNCVFYFDGIGQMVMQSIRPISSGEEITYSYVDLYSSRANRAKKLKETYYIHACQCERCLKTSEKSSEDAFMRMMTCSACATNPLLEWRTACQSGQVANAPSKFASLGLEKSGSGNMYCTTPGCNKVYKKSDIDEACANVQALLQQSVLMYQSGDFEDAAEYVEQRILFAPKPISSTHPFFHPYHEVMFNAYTQLLHYFRAITEPTIDHVQSILRYSSAALECLDVQLLNNHPEFATFLSMKGQAFLQLHQLIQQRIESDEAITIRQIPRLVRKDTTQSSLTGLEDELLKLNLSASSSSSTSTTTTTTPTASSIDTSSTSSTDSHPLGVLSDLNIAGYLNLSRAREIHRICSNPGLTALTALNKQIEQLKPAYEKWKATNQPAPQGSGAAANDKKQKKKK